MQERALSDTGQAGNPVAVGAIFALARIARLGMD